MADAGNSPDATISHLRRLAFFRWATSALSRPIRPPDDSVDGDYQRVELSLQLDHALGHFLQGAIRFLHGAIHENLRGMRTRMLLQVHDELVFESPPEEVETVRAMVKSEMESVERLEVPMVVDVGVGDNWRDAK